jgi:hypothetical protein
MGHSRYFFNLVQKDTRDIEKYLSEGNQSTRTMLKEASSHDRLLADLNQMVENVEEAFPEKWNKILKWHPIIGGPLPDKPYLTHEKAFTDDRHVQASIQKLEKKGIINCEVKTHPNGTKQIFIPAHIAADPLGTAIKGMKGCLANRTPQNLITFFSHAQRANKLAEKESTQVRDHCRTEIRKLSDLAAGALSDFPDLSAAVGGLAALINGQVILPSAAAVAASTPAAASASTAADTRLQSATVVSTPAPSR